MAEEAKQNNAGRDAEPPPEQGKAKTPGKRAGWRRLLTPKWIAVLVLATVTVHGIGFACFRLLGDSHAVKRSPEVSLGTFRFEANQNEVGHIAEAEFALHIALLDRVEGAARPRIEAHRLRVQQGVEELLRQAHGGDFEDPKLGELKRRLQEKIGETLGMRVIADVIITDLKLVHSDRARNLATETAESVPWVEDPSG
jgi:hypothetical protein